MSGAHHSTIEWSLQNFRAVVVPQQSLIEIKLLGFVHTNSGRFDAPLKVHDCPRARPSHPNGCSKRRRARPRLFLVNVANERC
jgi:hypothetical protein